MEIHQLRYLVAIVDEGSFTAAANRLHVSQSGVSAQLAKLEHELGQQLITRGVRTPTLTPTGKAILPIARDVLAGLDAISFTAAEFAEAVRGPVQLGTIAGCTIPGFLDVVANLGQTHPGINLRLTEADSDVMQAQVRGRLLDLALIGFSPPVDADLDLQVVSTERLCAVARPDIGLRDQPFLADVLSHTVLCLPHGTGIRAAFEQSCARVGLQPRVDIEASSPMTLLGLAVRGAGVAVLPASSVADAPDCRCEPIPDADAAACLGVISRRDERSPAVRVVRDKLVAAL